MSNFDKVMGSLQIEAEYDEVRGRTIIYDKNTNVVLFDATEDGAQLVEDLLEEHGIDLGWRSGISEVAIQIVRQSNSVDKLRAVVESETLLSALHSYESDIEFEVSELGGDTDEVPEADDETDLAMWLRSYHDLEALYALRAEALKAVSE